MDHIDAFFRQLGSQAQGSPVCEGEAVEDGARYLCRCFGSRLAQIVTHLRDSGRDVTGREEYRIVGVEDATKRCFGTGRGNQFLEGEGLAETLPGPHRLLQQPEPHHVAVVEERAVDTSFVGELC